MIYDHLDLFSGLGCWAVAARANGLRTIAMCEREEWLAQGLERIWQVPCHRDIKTFPAQDYAGRVWLLTGSPPCQPSSCAGKRRGKADDRWLWDETVSVCEVIQPTWFIFENPPGLDGVGLDGIISDLERIGYEVATLRIPACAVNSPQLRDRFWIVGNAESRGQERSNGIACDSKRAWESNPPIRQGCEYGIWEPTQSGVVGNAKSNNGRILLRKRGPREAIHDNGRPTQGGAVADSERKRRQAEPPEGLARPEHTANCDQQPWGTGTERQNGTEIVHNPWQDFDWISFNDSIYRAPVGLYELAYESTVVIPKRFRAKLISALGNAIVWPVAANLIKAIKASDPRRPTNHPVQGNPP